MYQVINKTTNAVVRESFAYAPLEADYAEALDHEILNVDTGVRWDVGYQSDVHDEDKQG